MDVVLVFLAACIPARLLIALVAYRWDSKWLALPAVAIAVGLLYNFYVRQATHGAFGGPVWWNSMRLVHAFLFLAFAAARLRGHPEAWRLLVADVAVALLAHAALRPT